MTKKKKKKEAAQETEQEGGGKKRRGRCESQTGVLVFCLFSAFLRRHLNVALRPARFNRQMSA